MSDIKLPTKAGTVLEYGQLIGSSLALFCAQVLAQHQGTIVIITDDMQQTTRLHEELKQYTSYPTLLFPDWETQACFT